MLEDVKWSSRYNHRKYSHRRIKENPRVMDILLFIFDFKDKNDYSPTVREIGNAIHITSTSVVNYYLRRLRTQDFLDFNPREARTLRLTKKGKEYVNNLTMPKRRKSDEPFCAIEVDPQTSVITTR